MAVIMAGMYHMDTVTEDTTTLVMVDLLMPSQKPKLKLIQPMYTPVLLTHTPALMDTHTPVLMDTHTPVLITDPTLSTRDLPMPSQKLKLKPSQPTLMAISDTDMVMAVYTAVLMDTHMPTQHTDTEPIFYTRDPPMPSQRLRPSQLMVTDHMVTVITVTHMHVATEDITDTEPIF